MARQILMLDQVYTSHNRNEQVCAAMAHDRRPADVASEDSTREPASRMRWCHNICALTTIANFRSNVDGPKLDAAH